MNDENATEAIYVRPTDLKLFRTLMTREFTSLPADMFGKLVYEAFASRGLDPSNPNNRIRPAKDPETANA